MSYYVRPMRKEDIPQINKIDREAFPTQWPPPDYRRGLQNPLARLIVACDEEKMIAQPEVGTSPKKGISGLVPRIVRLFSHEHDKPEIQYIFGFASMWIMADEAHLTNIAVRHNYQRQGIGEQLLISIIDLATELNANIVTLEVRASNATAQRLYRKYGFAQAGVRTAYYTDNREDALIMSTESITSASFQARFQQLKQAHCRKYGTRKMVHAGGA
ncbi:ribosomal protein S18-alanine N-acetyltransferase [Chloroflexota bacterium]